MLVGLNLYLVHVQVDCKRAQVQHALTGAMGNRRFALAIRFLVAMLLVISLSIYAVKLLVPHNVLLEYRFTAYR